MLFSGGKIALKPEHEEVAEQVGVNGLGAAADVVLLEATITFTQGGIVLSRRSHRTFTCKGSRNGLHPRSAA